MNEESRRERSVKKRLVTKKPKKKNTSTLKIIIILSLALILVAFFVFKVRKHQVEGKSMEPTLENDDHLIVFKEKEPERYSVVTFQDKTTNSGYVKRIIGMPGDKLWLDNNTLYINQQVQKEKRPKVNSQLSGEALPDGTFKVWVSVEVAKQLSQKQEISQGQFFVLGDNRNHSKDSRELGLINENQLEGIVIARYYPVNRLSLIH